jgi:Na+-driven multidrug efflux pump
MLSVVNGKKGVLAGKISEMFDISLDFVKKFFNTALPVILNEGLWSLGITMYSAAYARIGTGAVAAVQISNTIQNLFMTIFFGLGNACAVMIGNQIGAGKKETAISYSKKYSIITPTFGIIMGLLLMLFSPAILNLFNISPEVRVNVHRILNILSLIMFMKAYNIIVVVGILRSGGDTRFSLFLDTGGIWLIGVPLSFIGALVWKLPVYYVVALVSIEEVFKFTIGIIRVVSKKWVRNVIEHM